MHFNLYKNRINVFKYNSFLMIYIIFVADDRISFEENQLNDELFEICYDLKSIYSSMGLEMNEIDNSQNALVIYYII